MWGCYGHHSMPLIKHNKTANITKAGFMKEPT